MDNYITYLVIFSVAAITFAFRFLPFAFFKYIQNNKTLNFIQMFLPASVMLLLVIYTLKGLSAQPLSDGIMELLSVLIVMLLHVKWRNALLSIVGGTGFFVIGLMIVH